MAQDTRTGMADPDNTYEDKVEEVLSEDRRDRIQTVEDRMGLIRKVLDVCESPIERLFLAQWANHSVMTPHTERKKLETDPTEWYRQPHLSYRHFGVPALARFTIRIYPQVTLRPEGNLFTGDQKYRVDFLAILERSEEKRLMHTPDPTIYAQLVIELDGHDYHERTKEQARRDRSRDRAFTTSGITVMRFTGSEVWNETCRCLGEVEEWLFGRGKEVIDEHGL